MMGAFFPQRADLGHMKARGFMETGLLPLYPKGARCYEVNSPFASPYRGDGSRRSSRFFWGLHGGMDIPAPGGTPILAVAAGRVVHKNPGAQDGIGGIGVVLQHAPEDTGLPLWTYTEYKHLREMPALEIGRRVRMGEVIAHVGSTGTTGGHYGPMGHYHLHLTAWAAPGPEFRAARFFIPAGGEWLDPLALYRRAPLKSAEISGLPGDQKRVPIPYATAGGKIVPEGTKVVWPLACEGR
jgi:murein DD-endopeptidase MepM/ murein hydrolase activator NlpD